MDLEDEGFGGFVYVFYLLSHWPSNKSSLN